MTQSGPEERKKGVKKRGSDAVEEGETGDGWPEEMGERL